MPGHGAKIDRKQEQAIAALQKYSEYAVMALVRNLKADSQAGRSGDRPIADEMDARTLDARAPRQSVRHPAD